VPAIATSVAGLGIGDYDGQRKIIQYGSEQRGVRWNAASGVWLSKPQPSFYYHQGTVVDVHAVSGAWSYLTGPRNATGGIPGQSDFAWNPLAIHRADAAYAAGLRLQEKVEWLLWTWQPTDSYDLATVYFDLDQGDVISTLISASAGSHIGVQVTSDGAVRKTHSTGWVNSSIPTPTKALLAPHLYAKHNGVINDDVFLEFFTAHWRWVGDPTP
jgi:hypothetical protein